MGLPFGKLAPMMGAAVSVPVPEPIHRWNVDVWSVSGGLVLQVDDQIGTADMTPLGTVAESTISPGSNAWDSLAGQLLTGAVGPVTYDAGSAVYVASLSDLENNLFGWASQTGVKSTGSPNTLQLILANSVRLQWIAAIPVGEPFVVGVAWDRATGRYRIANPSGIQATTDAGSTAATNATTRFDSGGINGLGGSPGKHAAYDFWDVMLSDAELVQACNNLQTYL